MKALTACVIVWLSVAVAVSIGIILTGNINCLSVFIFPLFATPVVLDY